ncbi:MAG: hypothetical protein RLY16_3050 [Bacteroidota bacterium]
MPLINKISSTIFLVFFSLFVAAQPINDQDADQANIRSVRFHMYGDQEGLPVYKLNSGDRMELHFDDMDGKVKSYYYSYQLCDFDWNPVNLSSFDYVKGFTQQRITTYRVSSIAFARYTHYQVILPDANSLPSRGGNYLVKVFLDGDMEKTVFTRRLLVLDSKTSVSTQVIQPFTPEFFKTHQRVKFAVNVEGLSSFNPAQQIKVRVLQNQRWDNAQGTVPPTFVRGNTLEYNTENSFVFPGGKEWRWLDLRSMRLLSERIDSSANTPTTFNLFVKPDIDRNAQRYVYYQDLNGLYQSITYETVNPYWQADYATVHFSFVTPNGAPYPKKDVYLFGQLTNYRLDESSKLTFNTATGKYKGSLFLKQGYYSYAYKLVDQKDPAKQVELEGNNWETENVYTVLIYYKGFSDQCDRLIGVSKVSTRTDRPGISF